MKKIYLYLSVFIVTGFLSGCFTTNEAETPPFTPGKPVIVVPDPIAKCGDSSKHFENNRLAFDTSCYQTSIWVSTQTDNFFIMGFWQNLGENGENKVEVNIYLKEYTYTNGTYLTTSLASTLSDGIIFIEMLDHRKYSSDKKKRYYISNANQKVNLQSTGAGIFVNFDKLILTTTSDEPIPATLTITGKFKSNPLY